MLCLDGLATVAEVYLDGERILDERVDVRAHASTSARRLRGDNELAICCRALAPRLRERRRPALAGAPGSWPTGNLRFFRTMLIGRAPGFAPGPAVVGPWRPVAVERRRGLVVERVHAARAAVDDDGVGSCASAAPARAAR